MKSFRVLSQAETMERLKEIRRAMDRWYEMDFKKVPLLPKSDIQFKKFKKKQLRFFGSIKNGKNILSVWRADEPLALLWDVPVKHSFLNRPGLEIPAICLLANWNSPKLELAVKQLLNRRMHIRRKPFSKNAHLFLPGHARRLVPIFLSHGLQMDAAILIGGVDRGLRALKRKYGELEPPDDLSIERLKSAKDIPGVISLWRRVFKTQSRHCWFGARPKFLAAMEKELRTGLKSKWGNYPYLIRDDQETIVGFFSATIHSKSKRFSPDKMGGVGFVFDPAITGRRMLPLSYQVLLSRLQEEKVSFFYGGTSQPAVMKLARLMGRRPDVFLLRKTSSGFDWRHFRV